MTTLVRLILIRTGLAFQSSSFIQMMDLALSSQGMVSSDRSQPRQLTGSP